MSNTQHVRPFALVMQTSTLGVHAANLGLTAAELIPSIQDDFKAKTYAIALTLLGQHQRAMLQQIEEADIPSLPDDKKVKAIAHLAEMSDSSLVPWALTAASFVPNEVVMSTLSQVAEPKLLERIEANVKSGMGTWMEFVMAVGMCDMRMAVNLVKVFMVEMLTDISQSSGKLAFKL